jgi:hypothetical protein
MRLSNTDDSQQGLHDFQERLEDGVSWEDRLRPKLKEQIMALNVEQISFDEEPEKQLNGVDQVLTQTTELNIDVKVRDHQYYGDDVLIETASVVEGGKDGWVYNDATDIIAYCWENQDGTNLCDGVLILLNDKFVQWFDSMSEQFRTVECKSYDKGQTWTTRSKIVKIEAIPDGFIYQGFDPELPRRGESPQDGGGD